jgi:hypothetical protein
MFLACTVQAGRDFVLASPIFVGGLYVTARYIRELTGQNADENAKSTNNGITLR